MATVRYMVSDERRALDGLDPDSNPIELFEARGNRATAVGQQ